MPYATIAYKGYPYGTTSNSDGEFELQLPEWLKDTPIIISYMGYESKEYRSGSISGKLTVHLKKKIITLEEVQVKPLSPTDYIRLALRKIPKNYSNIPFNTKAYYKEKFTENGDFVSLHEAVFKSYFTAQQDTNPNQHQVMLYRTSDDLEEFKFMGRWIDKRMDNKKEQAEKKKTKYEKKKQRFERKGKEFTDTLDVSDYDDWDFDITEQIREGFGGPEEILQMDLTKGTEDALDSTKFKKFKYSFGNPATYMGMNLLTINYRSKRQMDQMNYMGRIYIDPKTDAIVGLDYRWQMIIPVAVKPLLFAFGMVIENPIALAKIRYQKIDDQYFPQHFRMQFKIRMKKKYMWAKNDNSDFFTEMVFNIFDINTKDSKPIPKEYQYEKGEPLSEQVKNSDGINWEGVNTLKDKRPKAKMKKW